MPYDKVSSLPQAVQKLPAHAQEIFLGAYNSAWEDHSGEKGREQTCAAVAWAAVKKAYEKRGDAWVTKESVKEAAMMGDMEKRNALDAALRKWLGVANDDIGPWVEEVFADHVVYGWHNDTFSVPYAMDEAGVVSFVNPPVVVKRVVSFEPVEALQKAYAGMMNEAGKHAKRDLSALAVKCDAAIAAKDTEASKSLILEVAKMLEAIKAAEAVKTEDGQEYPAAAFAYAPDPEKPADWKLRLWEDPTQKVTKMQLGRASAALSPGGFRGQKADIPQADLATVKRKVRAAYRSLDVADEDMPKWVQEASRRVLVQSVIPLTEGVSGKGIAPVVVIAPGFNSSGDRYYPAEMLARDFAIFEGAKMYADHPTKDEDKARPERSIKDWVATLKNVRVDEKKRVIGEAHVIEGWMKEKLSALREQNMLAEMGISINAIGTATRGEIEGRKTNIIERLTGVRSVDFVTEPGAGGHVELYEADLALDVDLVDIETFKARRPDIVRAIESETTTRLRQEVRMATELEEQVKAKESQVDALTKERDALKAKADEAEKAKVVAEAKSVIDEAISKSALPDAAQARLREQFKGKPADGILEAVKAEQDYVGKLRDVKVKGMGGSQPSAEAGKAGLREAAKRAHPEYSDAQLDTFVNGK